MSNERSAVTLLEELYKQCFEWLEGTMEGVTDEVVHHKAADNVAPIAGQVAHSITGLDMLVVGAVGGKAPLLTSSHATSSGLSEPPPQDGGWGEWGQRVKVDLPVFHEYAKAVFAEVNSTIAGLSDSDLERELDLPFGKHSVKWVFNIMLLNTYSHTGEVAVLKGLQGLKGYPL